MAVKEFRRESQSLLWELSPWLCTGTPRKNPYFLWRECSKVCYRQEAPALQLDVGLV